MVNSEESQTLESLLRVKDVFPPPKEFTERAWVKNFEPYEKAKNDPNGFWAEAAKELHWFRRWDKVLEWEPPLARWFIGGKINASYNCLDRHIGSWRRNKVAIFWEGEPGDRRVFTYLGLYREVNRFSNVLKRLGVVEGDRVTIYMPMIPELPIAMLACARIGAIHSVVFAGFSAKAIRDRINDAQSNLVITANYGYRRGRLIPMKQNVDEAVQEAPSVKAVVVYKRIDEPTLMNEKRDFWWHDLTAGVQPSCAAEELDSEHPLYILYTSGTTGRPKGIVHSTGGYLVGASITMKWVFDLKDEDIFWSTADIGWVTGHTYQVYAPLALGVTQVMYEGAPDHPQPDRLWDIVERYGVTVFYTAPTAIRTFMKWGDRWPKMHDLSSIRLLGTVGEPINPDAWLWYRDVIGGGRCPIVDTWWQTETGMIMITPLPGVTPLKPGSATLPFPGVDADVVDEKGNSLPPDQGGLLVLKNPWPAMLQTLYRDPERYREVYWSKIPGVYFTGDGARRDKDGYFWIMGRVEDVIKVSGHRLSTMEIESAISSHPFVAEAAVVGKPHPIKGQAIAAYVTLREGVIQSELLKEDLVKQVRKEIGAIAAPDEVYFVDKMPKTRSGKIMRRVMRAILSGQDLGDITTLEDPSAVEEVKRWLKAAK